MSRREMSRHNADANQRTLEMPVDEQRTSSAHTQDQTDKQVMKETNVQRERQSAHMVHETIPRPVPVLTVKTRIRSSEADEPKGKCVAGGDGGLSGIFNQFISLKGIKSPAAAVQQLNPCTPASPVPLNLLPCSLPLSLPLPRRMSAPLLPPKAALEQAMTMLQDEEGDEEVDGEADGRVIELQEYGPPAGPNAL
ncbi:hypothetical protein VOLCADRAFT_91325 [Volvox carteri f. nagariensis]|uniref:Uncharacterized protein n=1 Tax=Volvox carteri f. nagariensis TaxID=3068 RepID=D8TWS1_VOLCA|nr:uncharacterized protein VOLCADRAFT_91325 [Volvox carteri f. nagariensis]EFJ48197.1 hypothetical protein VOLCADRAFT_91325 [Volvox carteri f. nagariensis]|eukprot:XP_002950882.1 hypothetical protein VOLCADRAFT_91325 [Volvox carteri f. nagariensis]